jgi:hypothetical protein
VIFRKLAFRSYEAEVVVSAQEELRRIMRKMSQEGGLNFEGLFVGLFGRRL